LIRAWSGKDVFQNAQGLTGQGIIGAQPTFYPGEHFAGGRNRFAGDNGWFAAFNFDSAQKTGCLFKGANPGVKDQGKRVGFK